MRGHPDGIFRHQVQSRALTAGTSESSILRHFFEAAIFPNVSWKAIGRSHLGILEALGVVSLHFT